MLQKFRVGLALIASSVFYLGCVHQSPRVEEAESTLNTVNKIGQRGVASAGKDPSFDELFDLIRDEKIAKISVLLERLATLYPEYLPRHALAYESFSLQEGSYLNPRAIVFGKTAKLVISFNGEPGQKGFSTLETMSFSNESGYQFREIQFVGEPQTQDSATAAKEEAEFKLSGANVSFANAQKCLQCHGSENPRPIWQPYFLWPGMYGSDDDALFRGPAEATTSPSIYRVAKEGKNFVDTELIGFKKYLSARAKHERYQYLSTPKGNFEVYPDYKNYPTETFERRPNGSLEIMLSDQIAEKIVEDVAKGPKRLKNVVLLAALRCNTEGAWGSRSPMTQLQPFIDEGEKLEGSFDRYKTDVLTEDIIHEQRLFRDGLISPIDGKDPVENIVQVVDAQLQNNKVTFVWSTQLAALLKSLGLDLHNYSINLRRSNYFLDGFYGPRVLKPALEKIKTLRGLTTPPTCSDVASLLEKMKN